MRSKNRERTVGIAEIEKLYEKYLHVLRFEMDELGFEPTELRHLIGRLGEFHCALTVNGTLSTRVNTAAYDVLHAQGRRISVKTTAQKGGFVTVKSNACEMLDQLMVVQYENGAFSTLYFGDIKEAVTVGRPWRDSIELDVSKLKRLASCRVAVLV